MEYNNPVGVRAFGIVVHAPAVRGLREFLIVDERQWRVDDATAEIGLDDKHVAKINLYSHRGYEKRLQRIFHRPIGNTFDPS